MANPKEIRVGKQPPTSNTLASPTQELTWSAGRARTGTITIPCLGHNAVVRVANKDEGSPITINSVVVKEGGLEVNLTSSASGTNGDYELILWQGGFPHDMVEDYNKLIITYNVSGSDAFTGPSFDLDVIANTHAPSSEAVSGDGSGTVGALQVTGIQGLPLPSLSANQSIRRNASNDGWEAYEPKEEKLTSITHADFNESREYVVSAPKNEHLVIDLSGAETETYTLIIDKHTGADAFSEKKMFLSAIVDGATLNAVPTLGLLDGKGIEGVTFFEKEVVKATVVRNNSANYLHFDAEFKASFVGTRDANLNLITFAGVDGAPITYNNAPEIENVFIYDTPASYASLWNAIKIRATSEVQIFADAIIDSTGGTGNWVAELKVQYSPTGAVSDFVDVPGAYDRTSNFPTEDGSLSITTKALNAVKGSLFRAVLKTTNATGNLTNSFIKANFKV